MYYVYILANRNDTVLYTGVTNNLARRLYEHQHGAQKGFAQRYNVYKLVYVEAYNDAKAAIAREKQIKGWRRERKVGLIDDANPGWDDLAQE